MLFFCDKYVIMSGKVAESTVKLYKPVTKLWIIDCLQIPPHPTVENSYLFKDFCVEYIDVFGVVSGKKFIGASAAAYTLDDGTGEIVCLFDHLRSGNEENCQKIGELANELAVSGMTRKERKVLNYMMTSSINSFKNLVQYRELGDTVHVLGRLCEYREIRQVKAYHFSLVRDLNDEADRICELLLLYEQYKQKA